MSKVILFDVDGVLIKSFDESGRFLWSANIENDLGLSGDVMRDIFAEWSDCISGKTDTKTYLQSKLAKHNPKVGADTLINYWLTKDSHFDQDVMACIESLRGRRMFMATNQDKLRAAYLKKIIGHHFEDIFFSGHIGVTKPEDGFYRHVEEKLQVKPENIIFFDDRAENIEAARRRGWDAHVFRSAADLKKVIGLAA